MSRPSSEPLIEFNSAPSPDLLGRFIPAPYSVYLELSNRTLVLLETNDCLLISQAVAFGARIVHGNSEWPFRWRLLRDWRRPPQALGAVTSIRTNHVLYMSLGSGTTLAVDLELREAFGFIGTEVKEQVMVKNIFPLLSALSTCALHFRPNPAPAIAANLTP